ncbi:putative Tad-like Flp pilus-assembly [Pseudomonas asplenii]|uniref:Putative Tad-like Flp pilus-assembly n=1 Tax=Pseudomonas asplenii TaxID=53407 RepID=A0A0N0E5M4_9PSED|nr:pilus assembly protein TadG-related protein [Pseudomonas fuscovaginae]KPA92652.1 putative Tad-like Flp pilus-assembly [Pseudomonas fuscovaginae]
MSFPRRSPVFRGPSKQRGAIGLMAALTLGLALLSMVVVVDSGRLYLAKRSLQRVADTAALEAVTRGGNCQAGLSAASYATQSATRNGFTPGTGQTLNVTCGRIVTSAANLRNFSADATQSTAIRVIASNTVTTSIAAGIQALFAKGTTSTTTQLTATAVAATPQPTIAQLTLRSSLGTVDTAKSNLLNPIFSGLLGGSVSLTAAGWNGLLGTDINLLSYLDQLAIRLNVAAGNYTQLLNTTVAVTQLVQVAATVAQMNGASADVVTALGNLQIAAANTTPIRVGDLLQLQTGTPSSGLNANIQLFQLIQGFIQLSNSQSAAAATLPVNVLGLAGVTLQVKVIQAPQLSAMGDPKLAVAGDTRLGPNRIYVRTAQVRTFISVNLPVLSGITGLANATLGLVANLTPTLNALLSLNLAATINSASCLLGAGCMQLSPQILNTPQINVSLDTGGAESYVTAYGCPVNNAGTKSLTARTTTSIASLKVGQIDPTSAFASSAEPTVAPLPLIDLGTWTCHKILGVGSCGPARNAFAAGGIGLMVNTSVGQNTQDLVFASAASPYATPPNLNLPPSVLAATPTSNVVASLASTLSGISLNVYQPVNSNPLGNIVAAAGGLISGVSGLLTPVITGLLSPLLDPLVNNLLSALGINLNQTDVGANLTCGQTGKAYLVI